MINKKGIASFEIILIIISMFAFMHSIYSSENDFKEIKDELYGDVGDGEIKESLIERVIEGFLKKIKEPMIPIVSAACCEYAKPNTEGFVARCTDILIDNCDTSDEDKLFAETGCAVTSFCKRGCCSDKASGECSAGVYEDDCEYVWEDSATCNVDGCAVGCCVIGNNFWILTERQCEIRSGSETDIDWDPSIVNDGQCSLKVKEYDKGACVYSDNDCDFGTKEECDRNGGDFKEGLLCTNPDLGTWCKKPETIKTGCQSGQDGVYFIDSCGNFANIYDSNRVNNEDYWDMVIEPEDSCGASSLNGNANSGSCGNCDRFAGGICSPEIEGGVDTAYGDNYCKSTSCNYTYEGDPNPTTYLNSESWCDFDGKIGDGDDVVGSKHWGYYCSYGNVIPLVGGDDYRKKVCVQTDSKDESGSVVSRNAEYQVNNWAKCLNFNNSDKEELFKCAETEGCFVQNVNVSEYFNFSVCMPEDPIGFDLKTGVDASGAGLSCGYGTQTCIVGREPKGISGECKITYNEECLTPEFAEKMNNFCRKLGDCGGGVNIAGDYVGNYRVGWNDTANYISGDVSNGVNIGDASKKGVNDGYKFNLAGAYVGELESYADYVPRQKVGIYDYREEIKKITGIDIAYLEGSDSWLSGGTVGFGLGGLAFNAISPFTWGHLGLGSDVVVGTVGWSAAIPIIAAIAGAAVGGWLGAIAADALGLSDINTGLAVAAGAAAGAGLTALALSITALEVAGGTNFWNPFGWAMLAAAAALALTIWAISSTENECGNIEVTFECESWQPPEGGENCELCNNDPLKPCNEYRCSSLGEQCEIVNKGTDNEICEMAINPLASVEINYLEGSNVVGIVNASWDGGFNLTNSSGGDIGLGTDVNIGIKTSALAECRYSSETEDFGSMERLHYLAGNWREHILSYNTGTGGDAEFYITCYDRFDNKNSPLFYKVNIAVSDAPDKVAPIIKTTYPINGGFVGFDALKREVSVVTNEAAECKWDSSDVDYLSMANFMTCDKIYGVKLGVTGFLCKGEFNISEDNNNYYIRCIDESENDRLLAYSLNRPTNKISINWIKPNEDSKSVDIPQLVELQVKTSGGGGGHSCSYSLADSKSMVPMYSSSSDNLHLQPDLPLYERDYKIYVNCSDETGDIVGSFTEFTHSAYDKSLPKLTRLWQTDSKIHFVTDKLSECQYTMESSRYKWDSEEAENTGYGAEEKEHTIDVIAGKTYYIKCKTEYSAIPSSCLVEVQAV